MLCLHSIMVAKPLHVYRWKINFTSLRDQRSHTTGTRWSWKSLWRGSPRGQHGGFDATSQQAWRQPLHWWRTTSLGGQRRRRVTASLRHRPQSRALLWGRCHTSLCCGSCVAVPHPTDKRRDARKLRDPRTIMLLYHLLFELHDVL